MPPMITLLTISARARAASFVEIEVFMIVSYPKFSVESVIEVFRCIGDKVIYNTTTCKHFGNYSLLSNSLFLKHFPKSPKNNGWCPFRFAPAGSPTYAADDGFV